MQQKQTINSSRIVCWHATETDHTSFRSVCWHMPQKQTIRAPETYFDTCHRNRPYYFQKCVLTYATEADLKVSRSAWDICHRNRPKQFQKCMLTYHTNRPTSFRSLCRHTPQKQSVRAPELPCGTKLPMLLPLHTNLSLEYHNLQTCVAFVASHPYYQCCFLPKSKLK